MLPYLLLALLSDIIGTVTSDESELTGKDASQEAECNGDPHCEFEKGVGPAPPPHTRVRRWAGALAKALGGAAKGMGRLGKGIGGAFRKGVRGGGGFGKGYGK